MVIHSVRVIEKYTFKEKKVGLDKRKGFSINKGGKLKLL